MAQVFGKDYSKRELVKLVGDISQVAGMKKYELLDGKGRGVRAVDIWTGTGLCFTVSEGWIFLRHHIAENHSAGGLLLVRFTLTFLNLKEWDGCEVFWEVCLLPAA
jgi:hypothetical protein